MPWDLSSGFKDDYIFAVEKSTFGYDQQYQGGDALLLKWFGKDHETGEDANQFFSVGKEWETFDNGKTIKSTGRRNKIIRSSMYGHLITACFEIPGVEEILRSRGDETEAAVWEGLIFHLAPITINFGPGIGDKQYSLPVELITGQEPTTPDIVISPEQWLIDLIGTTSDFSEWMDQALDNPEVCADDALARSVVDPSGFYAQHKKG